MTDQQLEQRLRSWYRAEIGESERAPAALRASVAAIPHARSTSRPRLPWRFPALTNPMRLAVAAVIGVIAVGSALYILRPSQPAVGVPSQTPALSPNASQPAGPSAIPSASGVPARAASWSVTGSMAVGRAGFSATLLQDGRVLVAGGDELVVGVDTASAELYDPRTGSWSATGNMATPRAGHTATLLPDGRVLVAGGGRQADQYKMLASAELYDPRTGSWSATGKMAAPRLGATATLLPDGRVLVAGGQVNSRDFPGNTEGTASAEIYDVRTGTWTATASMLTEHAFGHAATLLLDGRVLVVGGACCGASPEPVASAELYDPATATWTATGSMGRPRVGLTATSLLDGSALVTGGYDPGKDQLASAERYDPNTGAWTNTPTMVEIGMGFSATPLLDGRVLVVGGADIHAPGFGGYAAPLGTAELYDPRSGTWIATAAMLEPSDVYGVTLLLDGRVLVFVGGGDSNGTSAELYDPGSSR
jgi:N-acetylneuraminic acid mutarotase